MMVAMSTILVALVAVLGACIGSFLDLVVWRVPRGESVVHPPSRCTSCGHRLGPGELIPVLSWIALRGHCRDCGVRISARSPLVELATALVFGVVAVCVLR